MNKDYPDGIDCVWLAADRNEHVAAFVTAGCGPIPVQALSSARVPVEDIEEKILSMRRVSAAQITVAIKRPDDFIALAERGLFVYDWSDVHRTSVNALRGYELVAIPTMPVSIGNIDTEIVELLDGLTVKDVAFSDARVLDVRRYLPCREPAPT